MNTVEEKQTVLSTQWFPSLTDICRIVLWMVILCSLYFLILNTGMFMVQSLLCLNVFFSVFTKSAEKYQEMLDKQDYFPDYYGENGNEE